MRDGFYMRTTLDIDEDVLSAAKELAQLEGKTAGQMLSELARRGLKRGERQEAEPEVRNDIELLPGKSAGVVTSGIVKRLLEEGP